MTTPDPTPTLTTEQQEALDYRIGGARSEKDAPVRLSNACICGNCYHPASGRAADGDPFWNFCRDCGCPTSDHTRMAVIPPSEGGTP